MSYFVLTLVNAVKSISGALANVIYMETEIIIGGKLSILYLFLLMFSQEFNNSISICVAILHLRPLFSLPGTKAQEDDCNICKKDKHEMK